MAAELAKEKDDKQKADGKSRGRGTLIVKFSIGSVPGVQRQNAVQSESQGRHIPESTHIRKTKG